MRFLPPGEIKLWDPVTGQERAALEGQSGRLTCLAFAPDGHLLATGSGYALGVGVEPFPGEFVLWDATPLTVR